MTCAEAAALHVPVCARMPTCRDVLCTDKTGTLTQDKVTLVRYFGANNEEPCYTVLSYAYLNAYFQTGLKNLLVSVFSCAEFVSGLPSVADNVCLGHRH